MSEPGSRPPQARRRRDDAGFTLIEVMVALSVLMMFSLALLPLLLTGLKAANAAQLHTQARDLATQRIETMRNLPFHVAASNGPYLDLLDTYFHDLARPSTDSGCTSAGYTAPSFTCVISPVPGYSRFSETVTSTFINGNGAIVTPLAGYTSATTGSDLPPSGLLAVTVAVSWTVAGSPVSYTTATAISATQPSRPLVTSSLRATGITVSTQADTENALVHLDAGIVSADGSLSTGSSVALSALGAQSATTNGEVSAGQAGATLSAPPDATLAASNGTPSSGIPCASGWACFGPSATGAGAATVSAGVPLAGSASAPLSAVLSRQGDPAGRGLAFSSLATGAPTPAVATALRLIPGAPMVAMSVASPTSGYTVGCVGAPVAVGSTDFVTTTGYLTATTGSGHSVTSCATTTTRRIDLFPTAFAPNGVVQITVDSASLSCTATGSAASVTGAWLAHVAYWNGTGYTTLRVAPGSADPLAAVSLATDSTGVAEGVSPTGAPLYLGSYLASWGSLFAVTGGASGANTAANGTLNGIVTVATQPTRDNDPSSVINLSVGVLSCGAQDNR